jgi:hypothetical protein
LRAKSVIVLSEETRYPLGDKNERALKEKSVIVLFEEIRYPLGDKNERKPLREKSMKVPLMETWYLHAIDKMKHVPFPYLC